MDPHDGSKKKKKKKKKVAKPAAEVIESGERAEQDPPASSAQKKKKKKKKSGGDATAPVQSKSSAAAPKKKKKKTEAASSSTSTGEESDGSDPLALHKAIWKDDEEEVARLLSLKHVREERINALDHRGNAPLHIAAHFANITIVNALLEAGANPEVLSAAGWRPLEESIATGSMECATTLMKAGHERYRQDMLAKGPEWCKKLAAMPDFYLELQWDFSVLGGWVPLVSGYIPNDTYKMWKRGSQVRLDYTLTGFKGFQITRGNVSFVFTGDAQEPNGHLFVLNHDKKTKQDFCHEPGEHYGEDVKNALDYLFAHDNCSHLPLSVDEEDHEVEFRHRTGWFSSAPTKEKVHGHHATVYDTHGMQIRTLIRSDPHAKQTRIPRSLQDEELFQEHRAAMEEYFDSEAEDPFTSTGRGDGLVWSSENVKRKVRKFEGSLWLSEDYPFKMEDFLTLIEVYSPTSQALKMLQEFVTMQMPEGFPVKIQLPVFYLLTATVQFLNLEFESPDQSLFDIPEDYEQVNEAYLGNEAREMFKSVEKKSDSKGE